MDYSPHLSQSVAVSVTPVEQMVKNNQTLVSAWDVSFSVDLLNSAVAVASDIYSNASSNPVLTDIEFIDTNGATKTKVVAELFDPSITGTITEIGVQPILTVFLPKNSKIFLDGVDFITSASIELDNTEAAQTILVNSKTVGTALAGNITAELNMLINNVIIHAIPNFEGERVALTLVGSKRVANLFATVQQANG